LPARHTIREGLERVAAARHELAAIVGDVCQRAETVILQFEQEVGMIKRIRRADERSGADSGELQASV
jgi:hypothetical protein